MPKSKKDWLVFAFKFLFSFSIIAYLLLKLTPISDIGTAIQSVDIFWLVLSFSLHALGLLISARRWQILIQAQGDTVPLGFLAQSYVVGNFFNLNQPGDAMNQHTGFSTARSGKHQRRPYRRSNRLSLDFI